jgi:hypothetical protein
MIRTRCPAYLISPDLTTVTIQKSKTQNSSLCTFLHPFAASISSPVDILIQRCKVLLKIKALGR